MRDVRLHRFSPVHGISSESRDSEEVSERDLDSTMMTLSSVYSLTHSFTVSFTPDIRSGTVVNVKELSHFFPPSICYHCGVVSVQKSTVFLHLVLAPHHR